MNTHPPKPSEQLSGVIERITFQSEETGYSVFKLKVPRTVDLTTVVGEVAPLHVGEAVEVQGYWTHHPKHGYQFQAKMLSKVMPATAVGLEKYLGSGLIRGVGPITAKRLIEAFGVDIIRIIEEEPERLQEVPKIGPKKRHKIVASWNEHKEIQNVMTFLQGHGISTAYATKIYKKYGNQAIQVVEANPYQLAEDIWGIGFKTADKLAQNLGHAPDSPARLRAGVIYALQKATEEGHIYLPHNELLDKTCELLEVDRGLLPPLIGELARADFLWLETDPANPDVYIYSLYQSEKGCAEKLQRLLQSPGHKQADARAVREWLGRYQSLHQIELSSEQIEAVIQAATHKVFILTGGPGTGKTTVSRAIIEWFEQAGQTIKLASPTGRAAKRLNEVSGREAITMHRLLEFDPKTMQFKRSEPFPLELDVLLLDEVSMVDLVLFHSLLKALPLTAHLILVGDSDQLPSVGPGAVLLHLLNSGVLPAVKLSQIFRQAQQSQIVQNAHRINGGQMPQLLPPTAQHRQQDAFFIGCEEPEQVVDTILELVSHRLPKAGYASEDIQVLCPMNRGMVGSHYLNQRIQEVLNPPHYSKTELTRGARTLRQGDRVIQLRNNYDHEVFNGDMGRMGDVDGEEQVLSVHYPDKDVLYDFSEADELALAYALSVHKSQGSEYPVVIMPVTTQHYMMLQRNLLYTGITRARKLLILVGTVRAVKIAVSNSRLRVRYSHLQERLREG